MQNADCGLRKSHDTTCRTARYAHSPPAHRLLPPAHFPRGVTLIELLIAIAIIAILATAFLGASRAAMEHARASRTRATINKIHTLLMEQWASYETRRVDVQIPPNTQPLDAARIRLVATRTLMQLEMPDGWSDIMRATVTSSPPNPNNSLPPEVPFIVPGVTGPGVGGTFSIPTPALTRAYFRRYNRLSADPVEIEEYEGAECLYMIVMLACGDGEARTLFSPQDIGDVDGDGAPEFLDGWGNPIRFIRWPAGFAPTSSLMTGDPTSDPDPLDHFRVDVDPNIPRGYRLVPLIFSAGPSDSRDDKKTGLVIHQGEVRPPDPYMPASQGLLGSVEVVDGVPTTDHIDNIHNHLIGGR